MNLKSYLALSVFVALQTISIVRPVAAQAAPSSEPKNFQALLDDVDASEKQRDIIAWAQLFKQNCAPGVVFTGFGQPPQDLDQEIGGEKSMLSSVGAIKTDFERVIKMTFSGKTATALVSYNIDIQGPPGKPDLKQSDLLTYSLVQSNGKWLIKSIDIKPAPVLIHGGSAA
jgi:hypothetical protein